VAATVVHRAQGSPRPPTAGTTPRAHHPQPADRPSVPGELPAVIPPDTVRYQAKRLPPGCNPWPRQAAGRGRQDSLTHSASRQLRQCSLVRQVLLAPGPFEIAILHYADCQVARRNHLELGSSNLTGPHATVRFVIKGMIYVGIDGPRTPVTTKTLEQQLDTGHSV